MKNRSKALLLIIIAAFVLVSCEQVNIIPPPPADSTIVSLSTSQLTTFESDILAQTHSYNSIIEGESPSTTNTIKKKELTAEEIYKKCSQAVFFIEVFDESNIKYASGSGFFVSRSGLGITNAHVLDGCCSARITIPDTGKTYYVTACYKSTNNDWAIIKINGSEFSFLEIGNIDTIISGATIYTIGSPLGLQNTLSSGLISNTSRTLNGTNYIQITAPISHGSSGGALINKYGEVIGITSAGFDEGQNLNLAIPINDVNLEKSPTFTLRSYAQLEAARNPYSYLFTFVKRHGTKTTDSKNGEDFYTLTFYSNTRTNGDREYFSIDIGIDENDNCTWFALATDYFFSEGGHLNGNFFLLSSGIIVSQYDKNGRMNWGTATIDMKNYTYDSAISFTLKTDYSKQLFDQMTNNTTWIMNNSLYNLNQYMKNNNMLISLSSLGFSNLG